MKKEGDKHRHIVLWIVGAIFAVAGILMLMFFAFVFVSIIAAIEGPAIASGNIAIIPITGVLTTQGSSDFGSFTASSLDIVQNIKDADEDDEIKAIILEIDSPGGTPVASDEIAAAVKSANKTVIAVIREVGASGAYWVASSADKIYANRMSVTGSIGVIGSYLEYAGLLQRYNITNRRLVSGKYKDAGDPARVLTREEEQLIQQQMDKLHEIFINEVAVNRNLPVEKVREIATGWAYIGEEAKDLGLVDELGNTDDAVAYLEKELGIEAELVEYSVVPDFFDIISGGLNSGFKSIGEGIGSSLVQEKNTLFELR